MFRELAQELGLRERSLVAGELRPKVCINVAAGPRDAQEPFHARPGEQGPVECLELADGVGDGEGGFAGIVFTRWRPDLPATA